MGRNTRILLSAAIAALVLAIAAVGVALASDTHGRAGTDGPAGTRGRTGARAMTTSMRAATSSKLPPGYTNDGSAQNKAAAAADARAHLKLVQLPPGSVRLKHRPEGDHGYLANGGPVTRGESVGWWIVPVNPEALIRYVERHRPHGSTQDMFNGYAGSYKTGTSARSVAFEWRLKKYVLGPRTMQITATRLNDGKTGVLVQARSYWYVLRSIKEWMPQTAASVQIHVNRWHNRSSVNLALDAATKARQVAAMVNSFPLAIPGMECTLILSGPRLTVKLFNSAGREIGQIGFMEWPGKLTPSDSCSPVSFTLHGKQMDPLVGGRFMWKLQRIAGHSLIGAPTRG